MAQQDRESLQEKLPPREIYKSAEHSLYAKKNMQYVKVLSQSKFIDNIASCELIQDEIEKIVPSCSSNEELYRKILCIWIKYISISKEKSEILQEVWLSARRNYLGRLFSGDEALRKKIKFTIPERYKEAINEYLK